MRIPFRNLWRDRSRAESLAVLPLSLNNSSQVIGATLAVSPWAAGFIILGLVLTTAVYLKVLYYVLFLRPEEEAR